MEEAEPKNSRIDYDRLTKNINVLSFDCGISNLSYCLIENDDENEYRIHKWENFSLNAITLKEACEKMTKELDKRSWMLKADHVAIEAQVVGNASMKVISHCLQMYFNCRTTDPKINANSKTEKNFEVTKTRSKLKTGETIETSLRRHAFVHFISPRSKFTVEKVPEPKMKKSHAKNKMIAILICQKILKNRQIELDYFNSFKKKDDLADSFLQGLYFLKKIKKKKKTKEKILDLIKGVKETKIVEIDETNTKNEMPKSTVYKSKNFVYPDFDINLELNDNSKLYKRNTNSN